SRRHPLRPLLMREKFPGRMAALRHSGRVRWIPYGPQAALVYFADDVGEAAFRRGRAVAAFLERHPPGGMREFVTSFTSVLLEFLPGQPFSGEEVVARLREALGEPLMPAQRKTVPVIYDGPDLPVVAAHAGLSE